MKKKISIVVVIFSMLIGGIYFFENRTLRVIDDSFIFRAEDNGTYLKVKNAYPLAREDSEEFYRVDSTSTLLTLTDNLDQIRFIKRGYDNVIFLYSMNISSNKITFDENLKVGISKDIFSKKFNIKNIPNNLIVSNQEDGIEWIFTFKRNSLVKIRFKVNYFD
jgi:hypothetical protein